MLYEFFHEILKVEADTIGIATRTLRQEKPI